MTSTLQPPDKISAYNKNRKKGSVDCGSTKQQNKGGSGKKEGNKEDNKFGD